MGRVDSQDGRSRRAEGGCVGPGSDRDGANAQFPAAGAANTHTVAWASAIARIAECERPTRLGKSRGIVESRSHLTRALGGPRERSGCPGAHKVGNARNGSPGTTGRDDVVQRVSSHFRWNAFNSAAERAEPATSHTA